jgi:hypothetical protein
VRIGGAALAAAALAAGGGVALSGAAGQASPPLTPADLPGIPAADAAAAVASQEWLRLTRRPVRSLRPLGGAHPGAKSIRVDRDRAALVDRRGRQRFPYPVGTTIVKTATRSGSLGLVAIMRKARAGSAAASWRYAEYVRGRGGTGFTRVGGGQALCRGCHVSATRVQGSDSVFTRLPLRG